MQSGLQTISHAIGWHALHAVFWMTTMERLQYEANVHSSSRTWHVGCIRHRRTLGAASSSSKTVLVWPWNMQLAWIGSLSCSLMHHHMQFDAPWTCILFALSWTAVVRCAIRVLTGQLLFVAYTAPMSTSRMTTSESSTTNMRTDAHRSHVALSRKEVTTKLQTEAPSHRQSDAAWHVVWVSQSTWTRMHIQHTCAECVQGFILSHSRSEAPSGHSVTEDVAKSIACALVNSRLDYSNSVLYGTSKNNLARLSCESRTHLPASSMHHAHEEQTVSNSIHRTAPLALDRLSNSNIKLQHWHTRYWWDGIPTHIWNAAVVEMIPNQNMHDHRINIFWNSSLMQNWNARRAFGQRHHPFWTVCLHFFRSHANNCTEFTWNVKNCTFLNLPTLADPVTLSAPSRFSLSAPPHC